MYAWIHFWLHLGETKLMGIIGEPNNPVTKRYGNHMSQFAWDTLGLELLSHHTLLIAAILLSKASQFED